MLYLLYAELFFFIAATSHLMCHFPLSISTSWGLGLHLCCFFTMYLARGRFSISICWMIWWTFHQGLDSLSHFFLEPFIFHLQGLYSEVLGFWCEQGSSEPVSVGSKHFLTFRFNTHWFGIRWVSSCQYEWCRNYLQYSESCSQLFSELYPELSTKIRQRKFIWKDWESRDLISNLDSPLHWRR